MANFGVAQDSPRKFDRVSVLERNYLITQPMQFHATPTDKRSCRKVPSVALVGCNETTFNDRSSSDDGRRSGRRSGRSEAADEAINWERQFTTISLPSSAAFLSTDPRHCTQSQVRVRSDKIRMGRVRFGKVELGWIRLG